MISLLNLPAVCGLGHFGEPRFSFDASVRASVSKSGLARPKSLGASGPRSPVIRRALPLAVADPA